MWNRNAGLWSLSNRVRPEPAGDAPPPDESPLDWATRHARAGHFDIALSLLDRLVQEGPVPDADVLDLRARICAQLGFHLEAERCWVQAMAADPANPLYPLALERLRGRRRNVFGSRRMGLVVAATAAVAILIGQGLQHVSELRGLERRLATSLDREAHIVAQMGTLDERQSQTDAQLRERVDALAATARTEGNAQREARKEAQLALARIEQRLDRLQEQFEARLAMPAGQVVAPPRATESSPEAAVPLMDLPSGPHRPDSQTDTAPGATGTP